jgi:subtilisin family serine protease
MWYSDDEDEDEEAIQSKMNFCFLSLVEALSLHPDVLSVSVTPRARILNYHARGIIQSGSADDSPFSAAGILGKGQVVGVADTGLDDLSCYFYDTSNNYGTDTTSRDGSVELNRRKVVQYNSFADSSDGVAGHGTHVVGSIVGAALTEDFSFANGQYQFFVSVGFV